MNPLRRHFYIYRTFLVKTMLVFFCITLASIWVANTQGDFRWFAITILTLTLLILFIMLQIWFFRQAERIIFPQVAKWMISKGRISGEDQILFPYASDSRLAIPLISHLTIGKLWLVDLYTPQIMANSLTKRARDIDQLPTKDPRFKYIPGNITLLPFQNEEIDVIVMTNVLNEITQFGDRERFLTEISRVLKPNGRILLYEPIKTSTRNLVDPSSYFRFWTTSEIKSQLDASGFIRVEIQTPAALTLLGRGLTPGRYENVQLPLEF